MFLRVCHFTDPGAKYRNIKCMKKQLSGMLFCWKLPKIGDNNRTYK